MQLDTAAITPTIPLAFAIGLFIIAYVYETDRLRQDKPEATMYVNCECGVQ